jgi:hypothetical protein
MVVEFAFCLSRPNASMERVFSLMTTTWTDVRNQMDTKTIEYCLIIKTYGLSCIEFYNEIIKNPTLLKYTAMKNIRSSWTKKIKKNNKSVKST